MFMGMSDEDFDNTSAFSKELLKLWTSEPVKPMDKMTEMYIDMVTREAWLKHHRSKLDDEIDKALDNKDEKLFMKLTKRKQRLNKYFGN